MHKLIKLRTYVPVLFILAFSCITPYDPGIQEGQRRIVIEGLISTIPGSQQVRITTSAAYTNGSAGANIGVENARVYVTDDLNRRIDFTQAGSGTYVAAPDVTGEVGRLYTLHVTTTDGQEYKSEPDLLKPVPPIDTVYWEYNRDKKSISVYVDLTDSPALGDGYLWQWKHYEQLQYCKLSESIPDGNTTVQTPCLDCCTRCWDVVQCYTCVNIAGDQYINGKKVKKQLITEVPYNSRSPYYLLIEQRSLSNNAYQFWNSVKVQTSSTGGPFDAAPAPIVGNIKNVANDKDKVLGFFGASAVIHLPYWLERDQINDSPNIPQPPDCPAISGPPPPCYPCLEDPGRRTGVQPTGWNR